MIEDDVHASTPARCQRRQALGSVYEGTMPFLRKTVDLGCKAVDAGAGGRGMDAFKRLAGDFGESLQTRGLQAKAGRPMTRDAKGVSKARSERSPLVAC